MTDIVKNALYVLKEKEYRKLRTDKQADISEVVSHLSKDDIMLPSLCFSEALKRERVILFPDDRFGFHRYQAKLPTYQAKDGYLPAFGNITPHYSALIDRGLDDVLDEIRQRSHNADQKQLAFYHAAEHCIVAILEIADRYRVEAEKKELLELASALQTVPHKPAESFYQACLFLHILIYALRCAGHPHITLGRFDQYMYPYFQRDIANGHSLEEMLETVELFFIGLNLDTDIYFGLQQGDNGQSMVLGGFDKNGNDQYNPLSELCMRASMELNLIDPKINLRCGKNTPQERLEFATEMTKQGLGFPQYCNDDVVIPGLIALGYDEADAYNYTVAACWEYIVPNCATDWPNRGTLNFPLTVNNAIHAHLEASQTFEDLIHHVKKAICRACDEIIARYKDRRHTPSPLLSLFVDGCLENGRDLSQGKAKYNNYGCHGAGISVAVDSLAAIKKLIFDEKKIRKAELLEALNADFHGFTALRNQLLNAPKMGNNDDAADRIAAELLECFSSYLNGKPNGYGGIWRAGTGSAMEYIISAQKCPATADGRHAYEPYGCSFSPSLTSKLNGPLSLIASFTNFDMRKIINGGPLAMELHDSVFRNAEGKKKIAQLIRLFLDRGGHQLQLNTINLDRLTDAQKHPEKYPNLIVRVWGWSGYFCELDLEYQNHIIRRTEFTL